MASFVYAAQSALGMSLAANSAAKTAIEKSDKATSAAEDAKAAAAAAILAADDAIAAAKLANIHTEAALAAAKQRLELENNMKTVQSLKKMDSEHHQDQSFVLFASKMTENSCPSIDIQNNLR